MCGSCKLDNCFHNSCSAAAAAAAASFFLTRRLDFLAELVLLRAVPEEVSPPSSVNSPSLVCGGLADGMVPNESKNENITR